MTEWYDRIGMAYLVSTSLVFTIIFFGTFLRGGTKAVIYFNAYKEAVPELILMSLLFPFGLLVIIKSFKKRWWVNDKKQDS